MFKHLAIIMFTIALITNPIKADDMDPISDLVIYGSAAVFGTMVGTTGLMSLDSLNDNSNSHDNRPTIRDIFDAAADGNLEFVDINDIRDINDIHDED